MTWAWGATCRGDGGGKRGRQHRDEVHRDDERNACSARQTTRKAALGVCCSGGWLRDECEWMNGTGGCVRCDMRCDMV